MRNLHHEAASTEYQDASRPHGMFCVGLRCANPATYGIFYLLESQLRCANGLGGLRTLFRWAKPCSYNISPVGGRLACGSRSYAARLVWVGRLTG